MSRMKDKDIERLNLEGPFSMSEADQLALEQRHDDMVKAGKRVREHLCNCEHGDADTLKGFDDLLRYIGIYHEVSGDGTLAELITQPRDY